MMDIDGTVNVNKTIATPQHFEGGSSGAGDVDMTMTMTMTIPSGTYVCKTILLHLMY